MNLNLKNSEFNFVYCIDNNFTKQAMTSLISLLNCINEKINIFIIHHKNCEFLPYKELIFDHKNINCIDFFEHTDEFKDFPNIDGTHITEATYYRLFIEKYLPKSVNSAIYLDADTICIKNPLNNLRTELKKLLNSTCLISAKTEKIFSSNDAIFNRLQMDKNYFNAGVMIIDLDKWRRGEYLNLLFKRLEEIRNEIIHWDQDLLNSLINGNYIDLNKNFNFEASKITEKNDLKNILFIHYLGSKKPWLSSGLFKYDALFYQNNYKKIGKRRYHIEHKWKKQSIKDLFSGGIVKNLKFVDKPLTFLWNFTLSLFSK